MCDCACGFGQHCCKLRWVPTFYNQAAHPIACFCCTLLRIVLLIVWSLSYFVYERYACSERVWLTPLSWFFFYLQGNHERFYFYWKKIILTGFLEIRSWVVIASDQSLVIKITKNCNLDAIELRLLNYQRLPTELRPTLKGTLAAANKQTLT